MAKREQKSNREKRKPKAEKPIKIPLAGAAKLPVIGGERKKGPGPKR